MADAIEMVPLIAEEGEAITGLEIAVGGGVAALAESPAVIISAGVVGLGTILDLAGIDNPIPSI